MGLEVAMGYRRVSAELPVTGRMITLPEPTGEVWSLQPALMSGANVLPLNARSENVVP
jgi:hypothetical protein